MSQLEKLSGNEVYTGWIYVIKNTINNKIYIGQTSKNLYIRFKQHKRDCEKNFHNMLIHKAMNKYGTENFLIRPVDIIKCVTLTDFKKELNKINKQGYAFDDEEWFNGMVGVSLPITNYKNEL